MLDNSYRIIRLEAKLSLCYVYWISDEYNSYRIIFIHK